MQQLFLQTNIMANVVTRLRLAHTAGSGSEEDGHQIKCNERVVDVSLPTHPSPILTTTIKTEKQVNHKTRLT